MALALIRRGFESAALVAAILAFAVGVVTLEVWEQIAIQLRLGGNGGGALLGVTGCAWLLWQGRSTFIASKPGYLSWGLVIVALALFLLGRTAAWLAVEQAGSLLLVFMLAALVLSPRALPVLFSAWLALLFALPVPGILVENIAIPLLYVEARSVELIALLAGFDVLRDNLIVILEGTPVRIDEDCSGFALLWPALLASWLALAAARRPWDVSGVAIRGLALVAAGLAALVANLLRIILTVFAYAYTSEEAAGAVHDVLGWLLVIGVGAVPFTLLKGGNAESSPVAISAPINLPMIAPHLAGAVAVIAMMFSLSFVGTSAADDGDANMKLAAQLDALPWRLNDWVGASRALPPRELEILGADAVVHRAYIDLRTGEEMLIVAAWHRKAAYAAGHGALKCYRARGWSLMAHNAVNLGIAGELSERFLFRSGNSRITVFETVIENPVPLRTENAFDSVGSSLRILIVLNGVRYDEESENLASQFVEAFDVKSALGVGGYLL